MMQGGEKQGKVTKLSKNEVLMLNIGSMCTGARVIAVRLFVFSSRCPCNGMGRYNSLSGMVAKLRAYCA